MKWLVKLELTQFKYKGGGISSGIASIMWESLFWQVQYKKFDLKSKKKKKKSKNKYVYKLL